MKKRSLLVNSHGKTPACRHRQGYGAFTYSKTQIDAVAKYILQQPDHHKKLSFKEEYLELLRKNEIKYSDDYLFDWLD